LMHKRCVIDPDWVWQNIKYNWQTQTGAKLDHELRRRVFLTSRRRQAFSCKATYTQTREQTKCGIDSFERLILVSSESHHSNTAYLRLPAREAVRLWQSGRFDGLFHINLSEGLVQRW
jgi:hypothetical protein